MINNIKEFNINTLYNLPKVVCAMSGGVDSAAACVILKQAGYEVIGVSMQVWDYRKNGGNSKKATCCAPADFDDARVVAEGQNVPFYVFDFEDSFFDKVIDPFISSYLNGETPNPCLDCNRKVKFRELRERAKKLGISHVATGHYAQIKDIAGVKGLFTSTDTIKDQSYFLYELNQEDLSHTLFPIGGMVKPEVRKYLAKQGLKVASKHESQDICFVKGTVGEFIEKERLSHQLSGEIHNLTGKVIGQHAGIYNYTVGQRRGLGVSGGEPVYVIEIRPIDNVVVLGPRKALERKKFTLRAVSWTREIFTEKFEANIKVRYLQDALPCSVTPLAKLEDNSLLAEIEFINEWTTISPGQAGVIYSTFPDTAGDFEVLGGGRIINN